MDSKQVRVIISVAIIGISLLLSGGGAFVALSDNNIGLFLAVIMIGLIGLLIGVLLLLKNLPNARSPVDLSSKNKHGVDYYNEIKRLCDEVKDKRDFFNIYREDDSIMEIYNLLVSRAVQNQSKAERFVSAYNFSVSDGFAYLDKLYRDTLEVVKQLNELVHLSIQIEDSASDVDTGSANDMLEALKEVFKEDI